MTFDNFYDDDARDETPQHPVTLTGRTVLDSRQAKAGKVTDVLFADGRPDWAIVKTGVLRGEHIMPLQHSYVDADGRLIVPLDKADVQHAPRIGREHVLSTRTRRELSDYYGVTT